jgi:hypothetical protein
MFDPLVLPLIGSAFDRPTMDLTRRLFYLLLPTFAIGGLGRVWAGLLNARDLLVAPCTQRRALESQSGSPGVQPRTS